MRVVEVEGPSADDVVGPVFAIVSAESRLAHSSIWPALYDQFGPDVQQLLSIPALDGDATVAALRAVAAYRQATRRLFNEVDLLASPTTPIVAPPIGAETVELGGSEVAVINATVANTLPYNLAHLPAVSLPCGFVDGLPVGLQLAGAPFDDVRVLRAALAYEQSTDWHSRRP
jgi:aspartyl-tRNA(Asn)/glutamyl-tRNA(Gln) amidotransferase subunit A